MTAHSCRNRVRFSLSDKDGPLHFTAFDIVDAPECREVTEALKKHLLGRPLREIDAAEILRLPCERDGRCMRTVAGIIAECQEMFVGSKGPPRQRPLLSAHGITDALRSAPAKGDSLQCT